MSNDTERLRKKLLQWHYRKAGTIKIVDLLQSDYQRFRRMVQRRIGNGDLDFREAIEKANIDELQMLDMTIIEERLGI